MILTEQQTMIRDAARSFAGERLAPFATERERKAVFPRDAMAEMAALGFLGMLVPEAWGGAVSERAPCFSISPAVPSVKRSTSCVKRSWRTSRPFSAVTSAS